MRPIPLPEPPEDWPVVRQTALPPKADSLDHTGGLDVWIEHHPTLHAPVFYSRWVLTDEEREILSAGGQVEMAMVGMLAPVSLQARLLPIDDDYVTADPS